MQESLVCCNIIYSMEQTGNMGRGEFDSSSRSVEDKNRQLGILAQFTPEQQTGILYRQRILSSLAYFIGKDFRIPVELNEPGNGWHWDFGSNAIRIDPQDLVDKPMDYLRFNISHEGGHRRISRTEDIPLDVWNQPGFSFMMNAIEDPRANNFVAEAYPNFRDQMRLGYEHDLPLIAKAKDLFGYQPRFIQAGAEYIRQWFNETQGKTGLLSEGLPEDVKAVMEKTLEHARESWLRYPSKEEADKSEELIRRYAKASYETNRDEIWPEFKNLIEEDIKDQEIQELLKEIQKEKGEQEENKSQSDTRSSQDVGDNSGEKEKQERQESTQGVGQKTQSGDGEQEQGESEKGNSEQTIGQGGGLPQELKDKLTDKEQQELESAIDKALVDKQAKGKKISAEGGEVNAEEEAIVDLDSLSEQLKGKLREYVDSLPEDKKRDLEEKACKALGDFEKELNEELQGKLSDNPERKAIRIGDQETWAEEKPSDEEQAKIEDIPPEESEDKKQFRELMEQELGKDESVYEEARREVLPLIDTLESDLREIFVRRRTQPWLSGFKTGKRIDIQRRMQEKAKGTSAVESKAWQKRKLPEQRDYAVTLLVDLSHSMTYGHNIDGAFKSAIVFAEALNRLSVKTEILGFNKRLYEYKGFGQDMSNDVRGRMGDMFERVNTLNSNWTDQGWALETASGHLARQKAKEKFLLVFSDGRPNESAQHPRSRYELSTVVNRIMQDTDQKLIGLGIGEETGFVEEYYPNSISNIGPEELPDKVADLLKEVIENSDSF